MKLNFAMRTVTTPLRLAVSALLPTLAAAQTAVDGHLFLTEESPENVLQHVGTTGAFYNTFASVTGYAGLMAIHTGGVDGNVLIGARAGGVRELDRATGALVRTYNPGGGWQWAGVYACNGDVLIGDMLTDDIRRYDRTDGSFLGVFATGIPDPADMRFGPNGNLFVCSFSAGGAYELDANDGSLVAHRAATVAVTNDLVFMPDGRCILTSMATNRAHVFDASWNPVTTFTGTGWGRPHGIDRSPHDGRIYAVDGVTQDVHVFHPTTYVEINPSFLHVATKPVDLEFRLPRPAWTNFGSGCGPLIGHDVAPRIGCRVNVLVTNARPNSLAVLLIGDSNTSWSGVPLPLNLGFLGAPQCTLLVAGQFSVIVQTDPTGSANVPLTIPRDENLVGASVYCQWVVRDPTANALGLTLSDGAIARIGG